MYIDTLSLTLSGSLSPPHEGRLKVISNGISSFDSLRHTGQLEMALCGKVYRTFAFIMQGLKKLMTYFT